MKDHSPGRGIRGRIDFLSRHPVWRSQYKAFVRAVSRLALPPGSTGLSVSCGDGVWDFLAMANNPALARMMATDVVDCPVAKDDIGLLNTRGAWTFQRVAADVPLPVDDGACDLVLHMDVIEHTRRPYLMIKENFRVLKPGGYLLCGTPNIFRPANILKLLVGRLTFPCGFENGLLNPRYLNPGIKSDGMTHVQEFNRYQLGLMLEEVGFEVVSMTACFFGISFLLLRLADFPAGPLGKNACQYLVCVARKPGTPD